MPRGGEASWLLQLDRPHHFLCRSVFQLNQERVATLTCSCRGCRVPVELVVQDAVESDNAETTIPSCAIWKAKQSLQVPAGRSHATACWHRRTIKYALQRQQRRQIV